MKKALFVASLISTAISVNAIAQQDSSRFYAGVGFGKVTVPDAEGINFSDANNGFIQLGYKINENFAIEGQYSKSTKDASASYFVEGMDVSEEWWDSIVSLNPGVTLTDAQSWYPYVEADIGLGFDATIETTAIYGVYRSVGDLYLKAKAGYLREKSTLTIRANSYSLTAYVPNGDPFRFSSKRGDKDFDALDFDVSEKATESESGFSGGLGVGYKFTKNLFSELEYTMLNDDLDFYSLSINYQF
jgi:opacity protein-like surface antigen